MRIVHLCSSGRIGGLETSVLAMLDSLRRAEPSWDVDVIAPEDAAFLDAVRDLGARAIALRFPAPLAALGEAGAGRIGASTAAAAAGAAVYARRLARLLRGLHPDIVHAHGIKMQVLSRWAAPRRARVIWHAHDYIVGRRVSRRALAHASGACDTVIANSRSIAQDFSSCIRSDVPITVIYNAVDLRRFAPAGPVLDLDALAGLPPIDPGTVRIGLVATYGRWKGQDVFLRALARLTRYVPWRAYIIGGPVYPTGGSQWSRDQLEDLARTLGVADRVAFTGIVTDVPAAWRALDIAVHASTLPEPFGMVIAEAMSCARPTVVACAGGAAEIMTDGVDAVGYPPGDDGALAFALSGLLADPAARARLAGAARRTAERVFDERRLGPELAAVYRGSWMPA